MKKCNACKEEVQNDAIKCKHCGQELGLVKTIGDVSNALIFIGILLVSLSLFPGFWAVLVAMLK